MSRNLRRSHVHRPPHCWCSWFIYIIDISTKYLIVITWSSLEFIAVHVFPAEIESSGILFTITLEEIKKDLLISFSLFASD